MEVTLAQEEFCLEEKLDEAVEISPDEKVIAIVERNDLLQEEKKVEENMDQETELHHEKEVVPIYEETSNIVEQKELLQEEEKIEEKMNQETEMLHKKEVFPMCEETEAQGDVSTEKLEKGAQVEVKVEVTITDLPKKSKENSKQSNKIKVTVPKPFSLEAEKRMRRERRGSMDFKDSKIYLSKSLSLNYKNMSQPYTAPERISDLKGNGSISITKTSSKLRVLPDEKINKIDLNGSSKAEKPNVKETEKKNSQPQVIVKKQEEKKLHKNSTFKALPLPSFYHQNNSLPKTQTKKIQVTQSKPPPATELKKTVLKSDNKRIEEMGQKVTGIITKGTISKLLRSNSVSTPKETIKAVVWEA